MRERSFLDWHLKVGRIFGIEIRLHFLFLGGALLLALRLSGPGGLGFAYSLLITACLFIFVLAHELGHCWAAIRNGGQAESILLWPLGGLATLTGGSGDPKATIQIAAAGPGVNALFCLVLTPVIIFSGHAPSLNPLAPFSSFADACFRLNLMLLLFNLLPAFPMDGGRILQGVLQIKLGFGRSMLIATRVGQVAAVALGFVGVLVNHIWLLFISLFVLFESTRQRQMLKMGALFSESDSAFGHDFSRGYSSLDGEPTPRRSWFQGVRDRRRRRRADREAREEAEIRRRVDEILEKVSRDGLKSLTSKERRFLHQASRRFRDDS